MAMGAVTASAGGNFTTVTPFEFTTNPATPTRAAWVTIVQETTTTDTVTAVTYGGVALTRIDRALDTSAEPAAVEHWFLGSGIPGGLQTVSITHGGLASTKRGVLIGYAADADTAIFKFGKVQENVANPSVALDTGVDESIRICCIFSGAADISALTPLSGISVQTSFDFGAAVTRIDRQTANSTGSFTIGYTAVSDDVAMVAAAIQEFSRPPDPTISTFAATRAATY